MEWRPCDCICRLHCRSRLVFASPLIVCCPATCTHHMPAATTCRRARRARPPAAPPPPPPPCRPTRQRPQPRRGTSDPQSPRRARHLVAPKLQRQRRGVASGDAHPPRKAIPFRSSRRHRMIAAMEVAPLSLYLPTPLPFITCCRASCACACTHQHVPITCHVSGTRRRTRHAPCRARMWRRICPSGKLAFVAPLFYQTSPWHLSPGVPSAARSCMCLASRMRGASACTAVCTGVARRVAIVGSLASCEAHPHPPTCCSKEERGRDDHAAA